MPSKNNICYNFMVCNELHEKRTIPLLQTVCEDIKNSGDKFFLIGGPNCPDHPNMLKLSRNDNYFSVIEKYFRCMEYHYSANTEFDWIFFGDDDTFVNVKMTNNLLDYIGKKIHKVDDLFVVCTTRHLDGREIQTNNELTIKGGAGFFMNRATFLALRNFCSKHNYEIKWGYVSDRSMTLIIQVFNSVNEKQISFFHCYEMLGDTDRLEKERIKKCITIHNKSYLGHNIYTMQELKENADSKGEPFHFVYNHLFSPTKKFQNYFSM